MSQQLSTNSSVEIANDHAKTNWNWKELDRVLSQSPEKSRGGPEVENSPLTPSKEGPGLINPRTPETPRPPRGRVTTSRISRTNLDEENDESPQSERLNFTKESEGQRPNANANDGRANGDEVEPNQQKAVGLGLNNQTTTALVAEKPEEAERAAEAAKKRKEEIAVGPSVEHISQNQTQLPAHIRQKLMELQGGGHGEFLAFLVAAFPDNNRMLQSFSLSLGPNERVPEFVSSHINVLLHDIEQWAGEYFTGTESFAPTIEHEDERVIFPTLDPATATPLQLKRILTAAVQTASDEQLRGFFNMLTRPVPPQPSTSGTTPASPSTSTAPPPPVNSGTPASPLKTPLPPSSLTAYSADDADEPSSPKPKGKGGRGRKGKKETQSKTTDSTAGKRKKQDDAESPSAMKKPRAEAPATGSRVTRSTGIVPKQKLRSGKVVEQGKSGGGR
ncbi:hypothetical protein MSAN_02082700 [Mycena sanguinolenta]|uniref:Uncharacterized protein n=1 Tax=Mycena sanguinolenta TaxID=230812 RepID=A0A8H6XGZ2_9AGAR|nr:hypothetical protein MSAN_02082700 [Mycena sanguinolenta]